MVQLNECNFCERDEGNDGIEEEDGDPRPKRFVSGYSLKKKLNL